MIILYSSHVQDMIIMFFIFMDFLLRLENIFFQKNLISYLPSECNEIDLLVKRLVLRKYNIKIIYDKNYKIPKNISLKPFNLDIFSLLKDIFFDFRIRSSNKEFKKIVKKL